MKGRLICPKCKQEFVLDVKKDSKNVEAVCPQCNNKCICEIKSFKPESNGDLSWVEHGEPRKTILSSIRPKTKTLMIASILLFCAFGLGITTAFFSETFIESSMDLASKVGFSGTIKVIVTDQLNNSVANITIKINNINGTTNDKGILFIENVRPGLQKLEISGEGYKTQTCEILVIPILVSESKIKMEVGEGQGKDVTFDFTGCTFIILIFSIFSLLASISCLKHEHYDIALIGSLIGIFSFGFFFVGSIISIIAFVLIVRNKEEFRNETKGKIF